MLLIYAPTRYHEPINEIIQMEDRLNELVKVIDYLEERPIGSAHNLLVKQDQIWPLIDWYNLQPPFILPESIPLNPANLLGILFAKLNNFEKVYQYLFKNNPSLYLELDFINRLQQGIAINPSELSSQYAPFEEYRLMHNQAILNHYTTQPDNFDLDKTAYFYSEAIQAAPHEAYRAFTAKHLAALLIDVGKPERAAGLLEASLSFDIEKEAKTALKQTLCQAWMQQLTVPYDQELLSILKQTLWEVLQDFEGQGRQREAALLYTDAGIIANFSESWAESLGYFNKALSTFEDEKLLELAANVHYQKGILLSTWAKNGNPQFYRGAAESFQHAIKVFSRSNAPEVYAEIQQQLGMIYAEIPDEVKKKSIWAAVSSSAFQEALEIFNKEQYPYEYATVCNHYGNALTKYPEARLSDNYEKALFYYQEALRIRTAEAYPMERTLSLLNYIEAQWNRNMTEDKFEEDRYLDMMTKAKEVLTLTQNEELRQAAKLHLAKLEKLKTAYV